VKYAVHTNGNQKCHIHAFKAFPPFLINTKNTGLVWFYAAWNSQPI